MAKRPNEQFTDNLFFELERIVNSLWEGQGSQESTHKAMIKALEGRIGDRVPASKGKFPEEYKTVDDLKSLLDIIQQQSAGTATKPLPAQPYTMKNVTNKGGAYQQSRAWKDD